MAEDSVRLFKPEDAGKDPLLVVRSDLVKEGSDGQTIPGGQQAVNTETTEKTT